MKRDNPTANAVAPENLPLPLAIPREAWPELIQHAARVLDYVGCFAMARELSRMGESLRDDRLTHTARALAADAGLYDIDRDDPRLLSLAALLRGGAA